jgi:hypothetical protein
LLSAFFGDHRSMPSGGVSGRPARSRSTPIASISSMFFLRNHGTNALRSTERPSGLPRVVSVRNSSAFSIGIVRRTPS